MRNCQMTPEGCPESIALKMMAERVQLGRCDPHEELWPYKEVVHVILLLCRQT